MINMSIGARSTRKASFASKVMPRSKNAEEMPPTEQAKMAQRKLSVEFFVTIVEQGIPLNFSRQNQAADTNRSFPGLTSQSASYEIWTGN